MGRGRTFPLEERAEAHRYLASEPVFGKAGLAEGLPSSPGDG
ncbi:MAG: hypothetical protein HC922_10935 [Leptolyngbyaceae cyanobacterium SM2_3_12]|nr:hypothetical protein [Leptolyngbyaceae cyanobacterium SM2_3_12]